MIQYKKLMMTLALLLTAVTGAWADEPKVYTTAVDVTSLKVGDILAEGFSLTSTNPNGAIFNIADQRGKRDETIHPGGYMISTKNITAYGANATFTTADGTYYPIDENSNVGNAWVVTQECNQPMDMDLIIAGVTIEPPLTVAWNASTKTGTFIQPGSDVVLTPIYAAATIYDANQTEKQAYETLKEAFAAVQDGDVIKLDWDVTLTEMVTTPSTASGISFTLDFNGHTIDGSAGNNYINIDNGCELTLTDNTATQMGGLKCQFPIVGSNGGKVIFQGGRYSFNGCSSSEIALEWDGIVSDYGWVMGDGKEFVDLNNGNLDDDGFAVRVDWKAIELTIGAGRFATFYMDQNITLADGTDANIGLYTINGEGINRDNNTVTVTKVNDPIAIAGMPLLVYNGTTEQKTVTLKVTPVAPTAGQMWSSHFQGTAVDKTFDADDMAANDYYVLSGGKAFAPVYGAGTIAAHKCWLQFDHETNGSAPARQLTIVFDETTGINAVVEVNEAGDDTLYDLNGRKLNGIPTKKGVYILNGRKVVIK